MDKEFQKYATKGLGLSSMTLDRYQRATDAYINPTIIEERKLNVASMDVFSRLMMDRIIFLGVPIDDDVANKLADAHDSILNNCRHYYPQLEGLNHRFVLQCDYYSAKIDPRKRLNCDESYRPSFSARFLIE